MQIVILSLAAIGLASGVVAAEDLPGDSFDFFYIEANEGGSSGGHVAVSFGDHTYHFQNQDGLIVPQRDFTREFLYTYALLNNRPIHWSRIAVSAATRRGLYEQFRSRQRIQERQLEELAAIRDDLQLAEAMLRARSAAGVRAVGSAAEVEVDVAGAGYFEVGSDSKRGPSASIVALRQKILDRYGSAFFSKRRATIARELENAIADAPIAHGLFLPRDVYDEPPHSQHWSRRISNLTSGLRALDVIERGGPVAPGMMQAPTSPAFALDAVDREAVSAYAQRIEARLVALVVSRREDWGPVVLAGSARLEALQRSLNSGHFVFVDSYAEDARAIDSGVVARRPDVMMSLRDEAHEDFDRVRRRFAKQDRPGEREWAKLEERANRLFELERGIGERRSIRIHDGRLIPRRAAPARVSVPAALSEGALSDSLLRIRANERVYRERLESLYAYQLISRNCVTEIFATINQSFGKSRERSQREVGGYIDGFRRLGFIPFISARAVNARYRVVERSMIDSYRQGRLRAMRREEDWRWVTLRESNTFSSTTYDGSEYDSFFVFFTQDTLFMRPLLGTVNVVAGLAESLWGGVRAPFDRGHTLVRGLKGIFVSLPELAFVNIRKGSNDWIAPEHRRVASRGADSAQ